MSAWHETHRAVIGIGLAVLGSIVLWGAIWWVVAAVWEMLP